MGMIAPVDITDAAALPDFRRLLAAWYEREKRALPWRESPSVYGTVVSELMAQQTRISTMLPYYERWMRRFPDFDSLADAGEEEVLRHWEGLGYYSRARNLHELAKRYINLPEKPVSAADWALLPGIGPYTAAAVSSIALGYPAAVVDGNVARILARLTNDRRVFASGGDAVKCFTPLADTLLDRSDPGRHNQAMMELGALVCTSANPVCGSCPVSGFCKAFSAGDAASIPLFRPKDTKRVVIDRVFCLSSDSLLLHRIPQGAKRLAGQSELPEASLLGVTPSDTPLAVRQRSITNHRITERIHAVAPESLKPGALPQDLFWIPLRQLESLVLSGPHRRWVRELLSGRES